MKKGNKLIKIRGVKGKKEIKIKKKGNMWDYKRNEVKKNIEGINKHFYPFSLKIKREK